MGNRSSRIKETRKRLKDMLHDHKHKQVLMSGSDVTFSGVSRSSSVCPSVRQSMLDVSMRSNDDEHSGEFPLSASQTF